MADNIVWFDIPVLDLDRAIAFYSKVAAIQIAKDVFPGGAMGILPHADGVVGGCLFVKEGEKPSAQGPLLYFRCEGRLDAAIALVGVNGGKILQPKHQIGPHGFRAVVLDSEGNRIALHSIS